MLVSVLRTPLAFLTTIGILVAVHEYGHYAAARLLRFRVEVFAIGFGKPILSWTNRHGVVWQIGWLPLGGYVKLHGFERPEMMPPEARAALRPGETFHDRPLWARAIVTVAGPAANFLLTLLLYSALFAAIGRPVPAAVVGEVVAGQPAARPACARAIALLAIDGKPISTFTQLQDVVLAHPDQTLHLSVRRAGAVLPLDITTNDVATPTGRRQGPYRHRQRPGGIPPGRPARAPSPGARAKPGPSWRRPRMASGRSSAARPVRASSAAPCASPSSRGRSPSSGAATFIEFIALLSVNLGLLNLLPIPVLDGGHLLFYLIEAIRGRPIAPARLRIRHARRAGHDRHPGCLHPGQRPHPFRSVSLGCEPGGVAAGRPAPLFRSSPRVAIVRPRRSEGLLVAIVSCRGG